MTDSSNPVTSESTAPAWQGRSRGTGLGYRIFITLLRKGGLRAAYGLLHIVGLYYRLAVPAVTRPLRYLYRQRMGFSEKETARLIKRNIYFFGQTLIDKVAVLTGSGNKLTFYHEGVEYIEELITRGEGGIIVSAHLGNWEVAGHMMKRFGTAINILMYDGEAEQLKALMAQYDQKRSFNIIYVREDLSHVYEVSAALRRGELVCIHADRFRPGNRTLVHDFLGEPAHFPAGPFVLASKLRAPVCFVFAFKQTTFHYHFVGWPIKTYEGRGSSGAELMLRDFVQLLEEQLRLYPHEWFNYYDFLESQALMPDKLLNQDVLRFLPHRPPFVMIDEIVASPDSPPVSRFTVTADNMLVVDGHFSASGLVENMAQTAGAATGPPGQASGSAPVLGYIGAVKDLTIFALPRVGQMLNTETILIHQVMNALIVKGTVHCEGQLLATCELKIFLRS